MNACEFEAHLKADGYTEIETQDCVSAPNVAPHRHPTLTPVQCKNQK